MTTHSKKDDNHSSSKSNLSKESEKMRTSSDPAERKAAAQKMGASSGKHTTHKKTDN